MTGQDWQVSATVMHPRCRNEFTTQSDQIYAYDLRQRRAFGPTSLENVGQVKGFHEFPVHRLANDETDPASCDLPTDPNFVEKHFAEKIEPHFKVCLESIRTRVARNRRHKAFRRVIRADMKPLLGHMVYFQLTRTREARRQHEDFVKSGMTALGRNIVEMETGNDTKIDPKKINFEFDDEALKASHIGMIFDKDTADRVVNTWCDQHHFVVGTTTPDNPFITSDHPVVIHNHLDGPLALLVPGMEFALPLNPLSILLIIDGNLVPPQSLSKKFTDCETIQFKAKNVTFYNSRQVFQCHSQVYSRDEDFGLVEKMLEKHPELGMEEWDEKRGVLINDERVL